MDKNRKKIIKLVEDYAAITLGLLIYVTGWVVFLLPKKIMGGGVSGIGAFVNYATQSSDGTGGIPVYVVYLALNVVLLLIGFKVLGKAFGAKTIYAVLATTFFFWLLPSIIPSEIVSNISANSELICAIMGGACAGVGIGLSFNSGGSSGGTDIIALIISKYRNVGPGRIILYIDLLIIGCSYFLFHDITKTMYGYVMIAVVGYTVDMIVSGAKQSLHIFVFSKHYEQIANRITSELHRGVTVVSGTGWYTKEEGKILMIVVRKYEGNDVYRIIREEDSRAFISVSNAMGVYGQGFDVIKK
jgi:uncharacterized membrane-anchored protein YitT (DUF2179 family)